MERQASLARGCRFLFNTYKGSTALILSSSAMLLYSKEGVTQGDALSMSCSVLSVLPLIRSLKDIHQWNQAWYTADANCGGRLDRLLLWFKQLMQDGPAFGHFPEPTKTYLVVDEVNLPEERRLFGPSGHGVQITGPPLIASLEGM